MEQQTQSISKYRICDEQEVFDIASVLVEKYHNTRCMLKISNVGFLWKIDGWNDDTLAKCCLVNDAFRLFFKDPIEFIIMIDLLKWNTFNYNKKTAIIDHELCHCALVENEKTGILSPRLAKHTIEEFHEVVLRNGMWSNNLLQLERIYGDLCRTKGKI